MAGSLKYLGFALFHEVTAIIITVILLKSVTRYLVIIPPVGREKAPYYLGRLYDPPSKIFLRVFRITANGYSERFLILFKLQLSSRSRFFAYGPFNVGSHAARPQG